MGSQRSFEGGFGYEWQRVKLSYDIQLVEGVQVKHEARESLDSAAINLLDLVPADAEDLLRTFAIEHGERAFRASQAMQHLWRAPREGFDAMHELPAAFRALLSGAFTIPRLELAARQVSTDGTEKFLFRLDGGEHIETVSIPEGPRLTLCISSQAGCALQCSFCATGAMGFTRNLKPFEIAGQIREVVLLTQRKPTNIVFMGMG